MCQNRTETIKVAVLFRINASVTLINNDFWSFFLAALGSSGLNLVTRYWFGYYQVPWISLLLAINMCSKLHHLIWTWLRFCIDCNVFKKILSLSGLNYHRSWTSKNLRQKFTFFPFVTNHSCLIYQFPENHFHFLYLQPV